MDEPPILYWLRVVNSDAIDYGRVGMLIDILDSADDPAFRRLFVVEFAPGDQTALFLDEVERQYVL